jgi:hypothetical protein
MENKSVDPTTATDEPNELLNVRLLQDEEQDDAKKRAAKKLSQNVLDESSSYSRKRQVSRAQITCSSFHFNYRLVF